jgi:hypothetical protein
MKIQLLSTRKLKVWLSLTHSIIFAKNHWIYLGRVIDLYGNNGILFNITFPWPIMIILNYSFKTPKDS